MPCHIVFLALLDHCFKLYTKSNIPKLIILECASLIIQHGVKYTHLALRLHEFLPNIIEISKSKLALKAECELLRIIYEICHHVSIQVKPNIFLYKIN